MGVQRRHAPAVALLRSRMKQARHYTLRYLAGAYPEGDVLTELFVHPMDLALSLFGDLAERQLTRVTGNGGETLLLQVRHSNGVAGQLELSTLHDWSRSEELLTVNTASGLWTLENLSRLTFEPYAARPLGIPLEKVLHRPVVTETHFEASRFLPQMSHQPLLVQGFYDSLRSFCEAVEGRKAELPQELRHLRGVHEWMDGVRGMGR
jgi:virulence factor